MRSSKAILNLNRGGMLKNSSFNRYGDNKEENIKSSSKDKDINLNLLA